MRTLPLLSIGLLAIMASCRSTSDHTQKEDTTMATATTPQLKVSAPTFEDGSMIPAKYGCKGDNVSPAIRWDGVPASTKSIALLCQDPDAPSGTYTHWVVFDLPPHSTSLAENTPKTATIPGGGHQGKNSAGSVGYTGMCPPGGQTHRYYFKVYALDTVLNASPGSTADDILGAMKDHVAAEGSVMGKFRM